MSSILVFCETAELNNWISTLCKAEGLGALCFDAGEFGKVCSADSLVMSSDVYRVFLFPSRTAPAAAISLNEIDQRRLGWIGVRPGGERDTATGKILLLAEISGDLCDLSDVNPEKWVHWLRKKMQASLHQGVTGHNLQTGGSSEYRSILYSDGALRLHRQGFIWKQFPNDNAVFAPS